MRMVRSSAHGHTAHTIWLLLATGIMLLLAGCAPGGTASPGAQTAAQSTQTATVPTTTATTTFTGSPLPTTTPPAGSAQTGCPEATQSVKWSPPPTVVVTLPQTTPIQLKVGDTIVVALAWHQKWTLLPHNDALLRLDTPAGYGDTSRQSCVWHFTALTSGQENLHFSGEPMCANQPGCAGPVRLVDLTIQVKSP